MALINDEDSGWNQDEDEYQDRVDGNGNTSSDQAGAGGRLIERAQRLRKIIANDWTLNIWVNVNTGKTAPARMSLDSKSDVYDVSYEFLKKWNIDLTNKEPVPADFQLEIKELVHSYRAKNQIELSWVPERSKKFRTNKFFVVGEGDDEDLDFDIIVSCAELNCYLRQGPSAQPLQSRKKTTKESEAEKEAREQKEQEEARKERERLREAAKAKKDAQEQKEQEEARKERERLKEAAKAKKDAK